MRAATNLPCSRRWPASGTEKANAEVPRAQYYPLLGLTAQLLEGTTNNTTASYLDSPLRRSAAHRRYALDEQQRRGWKPLRLDAGGGRPEPGDLRLRAHRGRVRRGRRAVTIAARAAEHPAPRHRAERRGGLLRGPRGEVDPAGLRGRLPALARAPQFRERGRQVGPSLADRADARRGGSRAASTPRGSGRAAGSPRPRRCWPPPSARPSLVLDAADETPGPIRPAGAPERHPARLRARSAPAGGAGAAAPAGAGDAGGGRAVPSGPPPLRRHLGSRRRLGAQQRGRRPPARFSPERPQLGRGAGVELAALRFRRINARQRASAGGRAGAALGDRSRAPAGGRRGRAGLRRRGRGAGGAAVAAARARGRPRQLRPGRRALQGRPRHQRRAGRRRGAARRRRIRLAIGVFDLAKRARRSAAPSPKESTDHPCIRARGLRHDPTTIPRTASAKSKLPLAIGASAVGDRPRRRVDGVARRGAHQQGRALGRAPSRSRSCAPSGRTYRPRAPTWARCSLAPGHVGPQLVSAYVDTVLVRPGAVVKRGEVLATLDCRDASAASQAIAARARALDARQKALAHEATRTQGLLGRRLRLAERGRAEDAPQSASEAAQLESRAGQAGRAARSRSTTASCARPSTARSRSAPIDPGAFVRPGNTDRLGRRSRAPCA